MLSCKCCCIVVILAFLLPDPDNLKVTCVQVNEAWKEVGKFTGLILHNCLRFSSTKSSQQSLIILQECLKRKSLLAFDRMLKRDVIELVNGIALVRYQKGNDTHIRALDLPKSASKFDEGEEEDWKSQVAERVTQLFTTHVLKIKLNGLGGVQFEGRRRHKHGMMSQLFMFALIAAGVIVIPMGFQFLAILGGKALLLAKMALLMTSIQGLKKIATSNLNYGLYSYGQGPWQYDRHWPYEQEGHGDTYATGYSNQHYDILHPRQELIGNS